MNFLQKFFLGETMAGAEPFLVFENRAPTPEKKPETFFRETGSQKIRKACAKCDGMETESENGKVNIDFNLRRACGRRRINGSVFLRGRVCMPECLGTWKFLNIKKKSQCLFPGWKGPGKF